MATNQSFLDGVRAQAGAGMSYTRPAVNRSADQNNTISGNPGYSQNMPMPPVNFQQQPMSWQQQVMARQQQQQQLAQDPTNINYIRPQQTGMSNLQSQMGQGAGAGPTMAQLQAARAAMQSGAGGMGGMGLQFGGQPGGSPQQSMFIQPRPRMGGAPVPGNMAAGPSGFRFVRPMAR